jgi:hypothetical protein
MIDWIRRIRTEVSPAALASPESGEVSRNSQMRRGAAKNSPPLTHDAPGYQRKRVRAVPGCHSRVRIEWPRGGDQVRGQSGQRVRRGGIGVAGRDADANHV